MSTWSWGNCTPPFRVNWKIYGWLHFTITAKGHKKWSQRKILKYAKYAFFYDLCQELIFDVVEEWRTNFIFLVVWGKMNFLLDGSLQPVLFLMWSLMLGIFSSPACPVCQNANNPLALMMDQMILLPAKHIEFLTRLIYQNNVFIQRPKESCVYLSKDSGN